MLSLVAAQQSLALWIPVRQIRPNWAPRQQSGVRQLFNRFNCCVNRRHHCSSLWNLSSEGPALPQPLPRSLNSKDSWLSNLALSHLSAGFQEPGTGPPNSRRICVISGNTIKTSKKNDSRVMRSYRRQTPTWLSFGFLSIVCKTHNIKTRCPSWGMEKKSRILIFWGLVFMMP